MGTQYFYRELELHEGFAVCDLPKNSRLVGGKEVSICSGYELFGSMRNLRIACWRCQCVADRWVLTKGRTEGEGKNPVLNLYAMRGDRLVMMTRDHIIPKSAGGVDSVENLRPGCEICNSARGSIMDPADTAFALANPHLINAARLAKGAANSAHQKYMQQRQTADQQAAMQKHSGLADMRRAKVQAEIEKATKKIKGLETYLESLRVREGKLTKPF